MDEQVHSAKIKQFNADAVLVIRDISFNVNKYGDYYSIMYDVSLFDPELKKRFWRASVNNIRGLEIDDPRMRKMAEAILSQLKKDGFL